MSSSLFITLGFQWDRTKFIAPDSVSSVESVCFRFQRLLPEFVWDAGVLEGNPITFPEVKTLLEGVSVGGRKVSDQEQILNLGTASKKLLDKVKKGTFALTKETFCELHGLVARQEALEWGHFRGEGAEHNYTPPVSLGEKGRYTPLATEKGGQNLNKVFMNGVQAFHDHIPHAFERALAFFLFGALQQFFFDGNKRTSRFMMNGILMSAGLEGLSVPAARAQEFNAKMCDFYLLKDGTEMMAFLASCYPGLGKK